MSDAKVTQDSSALEVLKSLVRSARRNVVQSPLVWILAGILFVGGLLGMGWIIHVYNAEVEAIERRNGSLDDAIKKMESERAKMEEHVRKRHEEIDRLLDPKRWNPGTQPATASAPQQPSGLPIAVRIACAIFGFFLTGAVFFYRDGSSKVQNRIDDFWKYLEPKEPAAVAIHLRFLQVIANALDHLLERVFGPTRSVRVAVVGTCLAVPCFFGTILVPLWAASYRMFALIHALIADAPAMSTADMDGLAAQLVLVSLQILLCAIIGPLLGVVLIGLAPRALRKWFALVLAVLLFGRVLFFWEKSWSENMRLNALFVLFGMSMWLVIGVFRRLLQKLAVATDGSQLWWSLGGALVAIAMSSVVPSIAAGLGTLATGYSFAAIAFCTVPVLLLALIWLLMPLAVVVHWILWQVVRRPLYLLMMHKPFLDGKKWLFGVGIFLLSQAFPSLGLLQFIKGVK